MNVINVSIIGSINVTYSDTVDIVVPAGQMVRAFHVNADGDVYVDLKGGQTNKKLTVKAGVCYPYAITRVRVATTVGAGNVIALY